MILIDTGGLLQHILNLLNCVLFFILIYRNRTLSNNVAGLKNQVSQLQELVNKISS